MPLTSVWILVAVGIATGFATLAGGRLALSIRSDVDLLLGFSSGTIIGVALFDLIPEALQLGHAYMPLTTTTAVAVGFSIYLILDRLSLKAATDNGHRHLGPASLALHSLLDGLAIGFAFHVSASIGVIVAVGVLAHDCIDGANTVALSLGGGSGVKVARSWLVADASAPLVGIILATQIKVAPAPLGFMLASFGGFFLYLGAAQVLPRSHARRPQLSTLAATLIGMGSIYSVTALARGFG